MLQYSWSVGEKRSGNFSQDSEWHTDSPEGSGSTHIQCTLKFSVIGTNRDGSYTLQVIQTNGTMTVDYGTATNIASGIDTLKVHSGRGLTADNIDSTQLLPSLNGGWNYGGKDEDLTGPLVINAVDVGDEWTQVVKVIPYGQSATNMDVSYQLIEWTNANGYTNVAKIRLKYTRPICGMNGTNSVRGSLSCVDYVWFAVDDGKDVKCEGTGKGTLTYNGEQDVDLSITTRLRLQNKSAIVSNNKLLPERK